MGGACASSRWSTSTRASAWRWWPTRRSRASVSPASSLIVAVRGRPGGIVSDNGTELTSTAILAWSDRQKVAWHYIAPGKPTDNAFIEGLNGKLRAECLNAHWFLCLDEARRKCEAWRRDYNEIRPHSAIGNQVPAMLHRSTGNSGQAVAP